MDMGIKLEVSAKGMQDHNYTRGVGFIRYGPRSDGSASEVKKGAQQDFPVKENDIPKLPRQGKYKMLV